MTEKLEGTTKVAVKWSLISEVAAKIIIPLTQLVLARILAPDAFGVLAIVIMITSFGEMLSDAGFQKYLIQHQFTNRTRLYRAANVAFISSMILALFLLLLIILFRDYLASAVGTPELGVPIAVASISLPLSVFVSIQQALFRREFEYKKLLPIRVVVSAIPLIVSVPLAFAGMDYWALIIGSLSSALVNAVWMTAISNWKPSFYFSFKLLRRMFSFSGWSLLEAISIWATVWSGTFIVGNLLNAHELGLYRQPMLVVNSAFALITNATTPILFAALSRLQDNENEFRNFFFNFQFNISLVLFPVGIGALFYRDFFTNVLFGPKWTDASLMFGAWSISSAFSIVLSHYCSEVFRSLGKPKVSFMAQCIYMCFMIPALYLAAKDGFTTLVIVNSGIRVVLIIINHILMRIVARIGMLSVLINLYPIIITSMIMGLFCFFIPKADSDSFSTSIIGIFACVVIYLLSSLLFKRTRLIIFNACDLAVQKIKLKLSK